MARQAKQFVEQVVSAASMIELRDIRRDKYFRINTIVVVDGKSLGAMVIQRTHISVILKDWCNQ